MKKSGRWFSVMIGAALMVSVTPALALTVTGSPSSCVQVDGSGQNWSNPTRAQASDGSRASASVNDGQTTDYLQCTGYGFSIPATAIIDGITVNVERRTSNTNSVRDAAVRLVRGGIVDGSVNRATTTYYTTSDVIEAHGGATDTWGGVTASEVNAANFGVAFSATKPSTAGGARTVEVDHISVTLHYTVPEPPCTPPSNVPAGLSLTCYCDSFYRTSLNPSPIFGADWLVTYTDSGPAPYISRPGFLRLTENTASNAKAATVPGIFPAAGNYISIEFLMYAYNGTNADGIAVTLSDYTIPPVPGAFGGSLGYAQKSNPGSDCTVPGGCAGFAGGWVGVGFDEYGNYQNPTEGRVGGPGARAQSISIRGSGAGVSGYPWLAGTAANLSPALSDGASSAPSPGHQYQVIVDARNEPSSTSVTVNRALTAGGAYNTLVNIPNMYTAATAVGATQAAVPANWKISFTGSTGGLTNIHEIGAVRICAQTSAEPPGGTASGFNAIDEAYGASPTAPYFLNGHIYMKVVGQPFKLNVAALNSSQQIDTSFTSGNAGVKVKLVNQGNSSDVDYCEINSSNSNYCSTNCRDKAAITGGSQDIVFNNTHDGQRQTNDFTINTAYKKLVAVMIRNSNTSQYACSTDAFSVRPLGFQAISTTATNAGTTGSPVFKAGSGQFTMTATTNGIVGFPSGYTGIPKVNNAVLQALSPATVAGTVSGSFPPATSGTPSSVSVGTTFTYSEVGRFTLPGYSPATNTTSPRGVYEGVHATECGVATPCTTVQKDSNKASSWTGVDSISSRNDCIDENYANTRSTTGSYATNPNYGKYGCLFGTESAREFGRFIPDHFALLSGSVLTPACEDASGFTYMHQPFAQLKFELEAQNASGGKTQNYTSAVSTATPKLVAENGDAIDLTARLSGVPAGSWVSGTYSVNTSDAMFTRLATPDGPYDSLLLGIRMLDSTDGVTAISGANMRADTAGPTPCTTNADPGTDCNARRINDAAGDVAQPTSVRFGRLRLMNAYGSERLVLPIPMMAQYYDSATGSFSTNTLDNCTQIEAENLVLSGYGGGLDTGNMTLANVTLGSTFTGGVGSLRLSDTANVVGSLSLCVDLGDDTGIICDATAASTATMLTGGASAEMPWLQGKWSGSLYDDDPSVKATFGVYKKANEFIYLREMY